VTVENMREANAARNVVVIGLLRRFGLAEDQGLGVDLIEDGMAEALLDPPCFGDDGREVCVELPIRSMATAVERAWVRDLEQRGRLHGRDRIVLVYAARGELLTNGRVRELLDVEEGPAREALQRLRDEGFLEQRGIHGGASYRLAAGLSPPSGLRHRDEQLDAVVLQLAAVREIANSDVRRATGLDRVEALALLDRLVRAGELVRTGERRGTRYSRPG
jgi:ATP-dependent DNA helicase RecG